MLDFFPTGDRLHTSWSAFFVDHCHMLGVCFLFDCASFAKDPSVQHFLRRVTPWRQGLERRDDDLLRLPVVFAPGSWDSRLS